MDVHNPRVERCKEAMLRMAHEMSYEELAMFCCDMFRAKSLMSQLLIDLAPPYPRTHSAKNVTVVCDVR